MINLQARLLATIRYDTNTIRCANAWGPTYAIRWKTEGIQFGLSPKQKINLK